MTSEVIHLKEYYPALGENGCDPTLEVLRPYNMDEMNRQNLLRPCMVICPGGSYAFCSQREKEPVGVHFLPEGYNVFILTYSVSPNRFPTQIREVAAVMDLIHKKAQEWNCDTNRIALMGFSAGGHLAAHYSTSYDCREVRRLFPESYPVAATVLGYPVISAEPAITNPYTIQCLIGHDAQNEEEIAKFSCDRLVTDNTPPTFIWHTADDAGVPVENSFRYAKALVAHNRPLEMHIYPYGGHGLSTSDKQTLDNPDEKTLHNTQWLDAVKKWLNIIL